MAEIRGLNMGMVIFVAAGVRVNYTLLPLNANLDPGDDPGKAMVQCFRQLI